MAGVNFNNLEELTSIDGDEMLLVVVGNLSYRIKASTFIAMFEVATTFADGLLSATDKVKLDAIAEEATKNAADNFLLNRANHQGTQPPETIEGLHTVATSGSYNDLLDLPAGGGEGGSGLPVTLANSAVVILDATKKAAAATLSNANRTVTFSGVTQEVVLANQGAMSGKYGFKVTFVSGTSSSNAAVGLVRENEALNVQIGYEGLSPSMGIFQSSGTVYKDAGVGTGVSPVGFSTPGNSVRVAYDATARLVWFSVNNGLWNDSAGADPATGTGGIPMTGADIMYPAICSDDPSVWTIDVTATAGLPAGFSPWLQLGNATSQSPTDVNINSPLLGESLEFDGTSWKNAYGIITKNVNTSGIWETIFQFDSTKYKVVKLIVHTTSGTGFQTNEVLITTTPAGSISQLSTNLSNEGNLGSMAVSDSGGVASLNYYPAAATNKVIRIKPIVMF